MAVTTPYSIVGVDVITISLMSCSPDSWPVKEKSIDHKGELEPKMLGNVS